MLTICQTQNRPVISLLSWLSPSSRSIRVCMRWLAMAVVGAEADTGEVDAVVDVAVVEVHDHASFRCRQVD